MVPTTLLPAARALADTRLCIVAHAAARSEVEDWHLYVVEAERRDELRAYLETGNDHVDLPGAPRLAAVTDPVAVPFCDTSNTKRSWLAL